MKGQREIFPVAFLATHRATYFETLVKCEPRNGKGAQKVGLGKKDRKQTLRCPNQWEGKELLETLQFAMGEAWMVEMVAAHTVGA